LTYPTNTLYAHYVAATAPNGRKALLAGPFAHGHQAEEWVGPSREAAEEWSWRSGEAAQVYFARYALVRVRRRPDARFRPGRLNEVLGLTRADPATGWLTLGTLAAAECEPTRVPDLVH
jgi:hypothetical protein